MEAERRKERLLEGGERANYLNSLKGEQPHTQRRGSSLGRERDERNKKKGGGLFEAGLQNMRGSSDNSSQLQ